MAFFISFPHPQTPYPTSEMNGWEGPNFINLSQGTAVFRHSGTPKIATKTILLTHFLATINTNFNIVDMKWEGFSGGRAKAVL